jgi:hypothetical protein
MERWGGVSGGRIKKLARNPGGQIQAGRADANSKRVVAQHDMLGSLRSSATQLSPWLWRRWRDFCGGATCWCFSRHAGAPPEATAMGEMPPGAAGAGDRGR